ncbi:hypothetical protein TNCV_3730751 [Trichonephila clavipes]|nr:hypothetical protein TNCV_3730751 [Trichonephila clavipes]
MENVALVSVFEKIVVKHLDKSLKIHTSRRRRWREFIRRKRPQLRQSDDWYPLHGNTPAHRSQLVKGFLTKTRTDVLQYPLPFTRLSPLGHLTVPINEETFTETPFCVIGKSESSIAGGFRGGCEKWFPAVLFGKMYLKGNYPNPESHLKEEKNIFKSL